MYINPIPIFVPQLASETGSDASWKKTSAPEVIPEGSLIIPFQFTGKTLEYFRIWIVNLFLTILTLGIYSAWAKVRTKRYFYANTYLDGTAFDYLAEPINILKGRLLVVTGIIVYVVTGYIAPVAQGLVSMGFLFGWSWLVVAALRFNARNSAYRNIRFSFRATMEEGRSVYWVGWFWVFVTLGLSLYVVYLATPSIPRQ